MKVYQLHREQLLPISIDKAWDFFSDASNLERITPPDMSFKILTRLSDEPVYSGMLINYIVKPLFGIPLKWTTEITDVNAPYKFVDKQIKGPYKLWEHTHTFERVGDGIKMTDNVQYALPFGILGRVAHTLIVKRKLRKIFDFRERTLANLFG